MRRRRRERREEVISSGTVDVINVGRSSSPPQTPAASSVGGSSPAIPINHGSIDWPGNAHGSKATLLSNAGSQNPQTSVCRDSGSSAIGPSHTLCRPWERGDLLRRLATFKPSNWTGKPKEVCSLSCARRGWMNIDVDVIECESCSSRITFMATASWTCLETDSAAEAFASQLDTGHKVFCPWRGNCCADSLAQFPPTPSAALIDGFKDRFDGLLQFPSLPVIAAPTLEKLRRARCLQIDRLLSQSYGTLIGELVIKEDIIPLSGTRGEDATSKYCKAQKIISLCGWEPRWLRDVQDCEEHSAQSARNAYSVDERSHPSKDHVFSRKTSLALAKKHYGKKKNYVPNSCGNSRFPLLDCSLCGATVKIWDFLTVPRPAQFGLNNVDLPETSKKIILTRGASATSGISGWVPPDENEKEHTADHYETRADGKSPLNGRVDLNLTMAGGLPSSDLNLPSKSEYFEGTMGRDLMIGQPSGSEVGDRAASYESRGPSPRKRSLMMEEGGSTVDRPQDRFRQTDSIEGTVVDRDGEEVDDGRQYSGGPSKRARSFDIFGSHNSSRRVDSSGAGPSRTLGFDINIDVNRVEYYREGSDMAAGFFSTRDSARASSVVAMDTVCHGSDDSMESVENYPGNANDVQISSPPYWNLTSNDVFEPDYSNQAQQSTCMPPAAGSVARDVGTSSTNEAEEIVNAETITTQARDGLSLGISGGSVGMGTSHEAEIHGNDASVHRTHSVVGDVEPIAEITENQGQMGESAPEPGLTGEFVPEEMQREDPNGDSQDVMSQSVGRADSGSKIYGSTKAESVESGEKISHALGLDITAHPSLSCNAGIYSGYDISKEEVTQDGKTITTDGCVMVESNGAGANEIEQVNGENAYEGETEEFDPLMCHNKFCPWVNGDVAAAGGSSSSGGSTSSISAAALCGWELTLEALDAYQSLGHIPNQTVKSDSAASLYKDKHVTPGLKLLPRSSASKSRGQL